MLFYAIFMLSIIFLCYLLIRSPLNSVWSPHKLFDIPDRLAHSQFTDMKCAIYPPWFEKILKFTDLKCVNIINLSTMVGGNFEIY